MNKGNPTTPERGDVAPLMAMKWPTAEGTPAEMKKRYTRTGREARGKFATVRIMERRDAGEGRLVAVKRQAVGSPVSATDVGVREWRITKRLGELADRGECFNFVRMEETFVERVRREEGGGRAVDVVLEYAGGRLDEERGRLGAEDVKEIAFQMVWALAASERFEFAHCDMHAKNVLLQRQAELSATSFRDRASGTTWFAHRWVVKISDFGLSRIRLADGVVVSNPKNPAFSPEADVESVIADLEAIGTNGWEKKEKDDMRKFKRVLRKYAASNRRKALFCELFKSLQARPVDRTIVLSAALKGSDDGEKDDETVEALAAKFRELSVKGEGEKGKAKHEEPTSSGTAITTTPTKDPIATRTRSRKATSGKAEITPHQSSRKENSHHHNS